MLVHFLTLLLTLISSNVYSQSITSLIPETEKITKDNDEEISITYEDIDDPNKSITIDNNNNEEINPDDIEIVEEIEEDDDSEDLEDDFQEIENRRQFDGSIIKNIIIKGNKTVSRNTIITKIPYKVGQEFDINKTGKLIRNIYSLGYFESIDLGLVELKDDLINLIITVKEKPRIDKIKLKGNKALNLSEIEKEIDLDKIKAANKEDLRSIAEKIKILYRQKNYHSVEIDTELEPSVNDTSIVYFNIKEGPQAVIKRIFINGNNAFSTKKLKSIMLTQEDWLLAAITKSKAGSYIPEMVEQDKFTIENFYQSNGYLTARVKNVDVDIDPKTQNINLTFTIDEGDIYKISSVKAPGNDILTEDQLLAMIPITKGSLYSREAIRKTMEKLQKIWGRLGYIYADISPEVIPDFDNNTVDITFNTDLGSKVFLRRINIIGHKKTRDYVIRRQLEIDEGQLVTTTSLDRSKRAVELLGFFEQRSGVNHRLIPVGEDKADLELILEEVKTGKLFTQIGYGGPEAFQSPTKALRVALGLTDRNFLGTGITYNINVTYSKEDQGILFGLQQPWLLGRPITGGLDVYHNKRVYAELNNVFQPPVERFNGGSLNLGFIAQTGYFYNTRFLLEAHLEKIQEIIKPVVRPLPQMTRQQQIVLQSAYNERFKDGKMFSFNNSIGQDFRNHPIFPSKGYSWTLGNLLNLPSMGNTFGYYRADLDFAYYTPLIGDHNLIFAFHGHAGFIKAFKNYSVPYRELFHIGGPATVRGYYYGQISPSVIADSLGGTKAFWMNTELIIPLSPDMASKVILFYDGGAGWDTPDANQLYNANIPLRNNRFQYRHAIGFGVQLVQPAPIRIYWGFKLDRNKRKGEKISEVHFSMTQDF